MGQTRFLSEVHHRVRHAAAQGSILDAYTLADELIASDLGFQIARREAVDTILAACVVYGAPLWLDPSPHGPAPAPAQARRAWTPPPAPIPAMRRRRDPGPALAEL